MAGDFIAHLRVAGLEPGTAYYYRVVLAGDHDRYLGARSPFKVCTAPERAKKGTFKVAFGSCARVQAHGNQPVWDAVQHWQPDLFLWIGDNVYLDTLEPQIMAEMYRWQRNVPNLQALLRSVPQLAIWDDHDYGLNDHDRTNPVKEAALSAFRRYWLNPGYGLPGVPGIFFEFSYGDLDFFMLDVRWYRDPATDPDGPAKTLLGKAQLRWLKDRLSRSRASFKIVASGSGWSTAKGPEGDAWSAYLHERDDLFSFIQLERVEGVVLLSGGTHVGELNCIPRSEGGGYDLYELVSSPLAQSTSTSWLDRRPELRIREVYAGDCNFGTLEFDTTLADPEVRLNLADTRGNQTWDPVVLKASELRNGVASWQRKIGAAANARLRSSLGGRDYYSPPVNR